MPEHLGCTQIAAYIDLGFKGRSDGFQTEALAYVKGRIVHAIQPDRRLIHLGKHDAGTEIDIWIEAAATPIIAGHEYGYGPTAFGDPATAPINPLYTLRTVQLVAFNTSRQVFCPRARLKNYDSLKTCLQLARSESDLICRIRFLDSSRAPFIVTVTQE